MQPSSGAPGGRHRGGRARDGRRLPRWAVRTVQVVAVVVSMCAFSGIAYAWSTYRSLGNSVQSIAIKAIDDPGSAPSGASGAPGPSGPGVAQNILLVGVDSRAGLSRAEEHRLHTGNDQGTLNTDVIMLVHIPADGKQAKIISLPRDAFVHIGGGWIDNKLNAAYPDAWSEARQHGESESAAEGAGANLLVTTVEKLTGVRIDKYVQVGFSGFEQIAHVIGSMPVDLCNSVDDRNSGFHMSAGHHRMNPVQMLEFVRQRDGLPGGDVSREKRQEYFLKTAFSKVLSPAVFSSPSRLSGLVSVIKHSFLIDGFSNLADFADEMSSLTSSNISGTPIPVVNLNGRRIIGNQTEDVIIVNPKQVRTFVAKQFAAADHPAAHHASGGHKHAAKAGCIN